MPIYEEKTDERFERKQQQQQQLKIRKEKNQSDAGFCGLKQRFGLKNEKNKNERRIDPKRNDRDQRYQWYR